MFSSFKIQFRRGDENHFLSPIWNISFERSRMVSNLNKKKKKGTSSILSFNFDRTNQVQGRKSLVLSSSMKLNREKIGRIIDRRERIKKSIYSRVNASLDRQGIQEWKTRINRLPRIRLYVIAQRSTRSQRMRNSWTRNQEKCRVMANRYLVERTTLSQPFPTETIFENSTTFDSYVDPSITMMKRA